jgi:RNA polymerase sigma-70 factor (ECF subfamily)
VNRERELLLAQLLERLPEDHRDVLVLRHLEGLSHEEIARRMGRSPGAVRMLWVRALARLQVEAGRTSGSRGNP